LTFFNLGLSLNIRAALDQKISFGKKENSNLDGFSNRNVKHKK